VDMERFYNIFKHYCKENNVVSEFIRFNPILKNYQYYPQDLDIEQYNETILMDLMQDEMSIWKNINHKRRNRINYARSKGVTIVFDYKFAGLDTFYKLYIETMDRLSAKVFYYFPRKWFENMISLLRKNVLLVHAFYQGNIIVSGLFLFNKFYMHYYLQGSAYEMRHLSANHLLVYEMALWAKSRGIKYLHLGGGFEPGDSLFRFKAGFSTMWEPFYLGKVIHDPHSYDHLVSRKWSAEGIKSTDRQFFPDYRSPDCCWFLCHNHSPKGAKRETGLTPIGYPLILGVGCQKSSRPCIKLLK